MVIESFMGGGGKLPSSSVNTVPSQNSFTPVNNRRGLIKIIEIAWNNTTYYYFTAALMLTVDLEFIVQLHLISGLLVVVSLLLLTLG